MLKYDIFNFYQLQKELVEVETGEHCCYTPPWRLENQQL